jgi:Mg2+-importing ATPase
VTAPADLTKTGTLSKDQVCVRQYLDSTDKERLNVLKLATVDASVQGDNGNNMDKSILAFRLPDGLPIHVAEYQKVVAITFSFERRPSGCIVRGVMGANIWICKGAFDEVLALCSSRRVGGHTVPLDEARQALSQQVSKLSSMGHWVILVATKVLENVDISNEACLESLETQTVLEGHGQLC